MKGVKRFLCLFLAMAMMVAGIPMEVTYASLASEAKSFEIGQNLTDTFADGETISYKFVLAKKTTVTFEGLFDSQYNQNIALYKKDGTELWSDSNNDWTENKLEGKKKLKKEIELAKGTYYVTVYNHSGNAFTYTLKTSSKEVKKVSKMKIKVKLGESLSLADLIDLDGNIKWSTANKKKVSVTEDGVIEGKKKGKTVITAYSKSQKEKILITVNVK